MMLVLLAIAIAAKPPLPRRRGMKAAASRGVSSKGRVPADAEEDQQAYEDCVGTSEELRTMGECAALFPGSYSGITFALVCEAFYKAGVLPTDEQGNPVPKEEVEAVCGGYCSKATGKDWCPGADDDDGGLGAGPIAGIVIGCVVVVGVICVCVYFFVIKPKQAAPVAAATP
jgi:hypothetical protein